MAVHPSAIGFSELNICWSSLLIPDFCFMLGVNTEQGS